MTRRRIHFIRTFSARFSARWSRQCFYHRLHEYFQLSGSQRCIWQGDPQLIYAHDVADLPLHDLSPVTDNMVTNVYGVPWIIGAKKGFPNFNEFSMENAFQITRKLEVTRSATHMALDVWHEPDVFHEHQQHLGVECWNSYNASYSNPVEIMVRDSMAMHVDQRRWDLLVYALQHGLH